MAFFPAFRFQGGYSLILVLEEVADLLEKQGPTQTQVLQELLIMELPTLPNILVVPS